eukprot:gb/GECG01014665.1/.p1 GENE.gb/GECG01014665.1/~~gb/GECG01014665.1/.p1  ORF type:complete len:1030 (+),score=149.10 gb/GECG01014665.1/:1-3090(+)
MSKFFESSMASGESALEKVDAPKVYKQSRQAIGAAFAAAAGLGGAAMNLLKLDVIRDFAQNVALFFAGIASEGLELAKKTFGRIFGLISIDLNMVYDGINPFHIIVLLAVLGVIMVGVLIAFYFMTRKMNPDEIRQGHEVVKWDDRKEDESKRVMFIKYSLLAATTLYLPVSRALAQAVRCGPTMIRILVEKDFLEIEEVINSTLGCRNLTIALNDGATDADIINNEGKGKDVSFSDCDCADWENYSSVRLIAIVIIILFTIGFPIYCVWLIRENKPYGSREDPDKCYDEEGELVEYTDDRYQDDLKNSPNQLSCPYLTLYDGFERKWSFYKVWVMATKFLLVMPGILWYESPVGQSVVSALILGILGGLSFYSTPFLDPTDDVLDASGRLTSFATVLFALFASLGGASAFSALVMLANSVNAIVMLLSTLWGFAAVRSFVKGITGQLQFSDSVKKVVGPAKRIIPRWDISSELKRRIWHPFWEAVLLEEGEIYAKRLTDMQGKARDVGKHRILQHWKNGANEEMNEARQRLMEEYEGVDVYYGGETHDGELNSKTFFGKMYIVAYPFHAVMVYDDSDDYTFIWEDRTKELLEQNDDEEIQRRRNVREKLRGLCAPDLGPGPELTYHLERWEQHQVPDGTEEYKDAEGNTQTRTKYATVDVFMTYSKGNVSIGMNSDLPMQAGFKFGLNLTDGHGVATAPSTGEEHTIHNSITLGRDDIGIDDNFNECEALQQLFENEPNNEIWPEGLERWQKKSQDYRHGLIKWRVEEESTLSSAFWLHVYDNDTATREEIEAYFRNFEAREKVKQIPDRHKEGLDYIMNKMNWVNQHPCAAIWYVFFDDLWETNNEVGMIADLQKDLDPSEEGSIAFRPMKREKLEEWLDERGLRASYRWITPAILDLLFDLMEKTDEDYSKFDAELQEMQEEEGEDEAAKKEASKAQSQFSSGVRCAYAVRRNTAQNRVVHSSLGAMKEGKVTNMANYAGGAYIPKDVEGEQHENPHSIPFTTLYSDCSPSATLFHIKKRIRVRKR